MSPGYVVQQVTGYGLSMIASRDIAIGELVACERPIVIFPAVLPSTEARMSTIPDTFNQLLTAAVDQKMQPNRRQMFYQLFNCKNTQYRVKDICDTNSFSLGALPGANYHYPYAGVFHDLSRINHSCSPNVTLRWDTETFTMSINAVQPIKAGEQIFLSYDEADLTSPRVIRRRTMSQKFNFKCNCTSCALAAPESKESNQRRAELEAALEQVKKESTAVPRDIKAWVQDKRDEVHRKTVAESSKVMDLMEKENIVLQALCDYHIPRLARAHCSLGNIAEAKEWANKMVGFNKAFTGTGDGWQKIERQLGAL
ncbi:hypothetical protein C8J56DRAFT_795394 [Mycena floridula]|nr:hypothetical protein C8J56DRAFT_795394 [Mycena floridula]